ncbi:MAG TPA: hemerythrin domain-containing protein [Gammaproteobacteria bacterium]|nr:hemerythrin domain-containing protein [Gammaproteobacteria bacterium]
MKTLKQWLKLFLPGSFRKASFDSVDEALDESFPASDSPAFAGESSNSPPLAQSPETNPLAMLRVEHQALMQVIYLISEQIEQLQQNKAVELPILKNILEFLREFVALHYHKEEKLLLPALEQTGAPINEGPAVLIKQDHESSLSLLVTLEKLLALSENNESSREKLIRTLSQLKDIYTRHTLKEENFIFPLAEKYLSLAKQQALATAFDKLDHQKKSSL